MARFEDDNDFSLSGLMQQGYKLDVTVISSSSDEDDNYGGLLESLEEKYLIKQVHSKEACSQVSSQMLQVS